MEVDIIAQIFERLALPTAIIVILLLACYFLIRHIFKTQEKQNEMHGKQNEVIELFREQLIDSKICFKEFQQSMNTIKDAIDRQADSIVSMHATVTELKAEVKTMKYGNRK